MFYRLLGMAVWKGGRFYVSRKYGGKLPPRALAGIGGLLVLAWAPCCSPPAAATTA